MAEAYSTHGAIFERWVYGKSLPGIQMSNLRTKMPLDTLVVELSLPKLTWQ
jgi:hypothetical protein